MREKMFGGHRPTMDLVADHPSADLTALNRFGCAAVQWAAAAGSVDTCRWLRARGLDLGHVNPAGHGAVGKAAWQGHVDALRFFLLQEDSHRTWRLPHERLSLQSMHPRKVACDHNVYKAQE